MSLALTQALLARLFTDEAFRRAFFRAPQQAAREFGLDEAAASTLARIDPAAVARYAECLRGKRRLDARKTLPLTFRALGPRFDALLDDCVSGPSAPGRRRDDAAALARHLAQLAAKGAVEPAWIGDLARFEWGFVEAGAMRSGLRLRWFRYPVATIAARLASREGEAIAVRARPCVALWLRAFGSRLVHFLV